MARSIFDVVKQNERESTDDYPVLWIDEKNIGWAVRSIRESIPLGRQSGEPSHRLDIASALKRGGIRISRTTIKVKS